MGAGPGKGLERPAARRGPGRPGSGRASGAACGPARSALVESRLRPGAPRCRRDGPSAACPARRDAGGGGGRRPRGPGRRLPLHVASEARGVWELPSLSAGWGRTGRPRAWLRGAREYIAEEAWRSGPSGPGSERGTVLGNSFWVRFLILSEDWASPSDPCCSPCEGHRYHVLYCGC